MTDKKDEIADLLERLQAAGAKVSSKSKDGSPVTKQLLDQIKGTNPQDFDAWISWTKSF